MTRGEAEAAGAAPIDGPWAVPEGWRWERLGDVADINPKTDFATLPSDSKVTFLPMAAVSEESGRVDTSTERPVSEVVKGFMRFRSGDVLFAKITPCMENGKVAIVPPTDSGFGAGSTEFHVVRSEALDPKLIFYFLVRRGFREEARRNMSGSAGQLRVPTEYLRNIPIPVPPPGEQRPIVARIDALFAEIEEGEQALAEARAGVETYRKALLKAAVTGDLTADWRDVHPPKETGRDLLSRIASTWRTRARSKNKAYCKIDHSNFGPLDVLPDGWCWTTVESVGDVQLGRQRAPEHHSGSHMRPYLRVANVLENMLDLADVKSMNFTPEEFDIFSLQDGDILLNEGQSPHLIGRPAIYRNEIDHCCFQKTLLRFRAGQFVLPEYALAVFRRYMHNGRFQREARITTSIGHLTQVRFAPMEFPVPPRHEQAEITKRLRSLEKDNSLPDDKALTGAALRQSILAAAFRGDLAA